MARPDPDPGPAHDRMRKGETTTVQGETQEPRPQMPHERDESTNSQAPGEPSAQQVGAIAHDDAVSGKSDTSKGAELGATYDKLRKSTDTPKKDFRR